LSFGCGDTPKEALKKMKEYYRDATASNENHGFINVNLLKRHGEGRI
jgi:hypothetical protein